MKTIKVVVSGEAEGLCGFHAVWVLKVCRQGYFFADFVRDLDGCCWWMAVD